jgi:hypothetical protein
LTIAIEKRSSGTSLPKGKNKEKKMSPQSRDNIEFECLLGRNGQNYGWRISLQVQFIPNFYVLAHVYVIPSWE